MKKMNESSNFAHLLYTRSAGGACEAPRKKTLKIDRIMG